MDTSTVLVVMDKYGPLGLAFVVVCLTLYIFVTRVLPMAAENHGKRLDALIDAFKHAMGLIHSRLDQQEHNANERHDEVMNQLGGLAAKIDRLPHPPSGEDKHEQP